MHLDDVRKRVERLTRLSLGLAKSGSHGKRRKIHCSTWSGAAYLAAIREAIGGVEAAPWCW